jgi:hypothetical protein
MLKPVLAAWSSAQPGYRQKDGRVKHVTLRVIGEGASGRICVSLTGFLLQCLLLFVDVIY